MDTEYFDLAIIGAGLIGSAAARYASDYPIKLCIIGPEETQSDDLKQERDIFGSHYDEARITRSTATDPVWAQLAARSRMQFHDLEVKSGVHFYDEVGNLTIGFKNGETITKTRQAAELGKVGAVTMDAAVSRRTFPYLHVREDEEAVWEEMNAGIVNPRKMLEAELVIAKQNDCSVIRDIVINVEYPQRRGVHHILTTHSGRTIIANKILITCGAFAEIKPILPVGIQPKVDYITQTVIFAEVCPKDLHSFKGMPCVVRELETEQMIDNACYVLPPVRYPDGKYYIKLGHGRQFNRKILKDAIKPWFCNKPPDDIVRGLVTALRTLFPDFKPANISTDTCVTTHTPTGRLYLDLLTPKAGVVIGCNGYAAKSCDHIGKIAADMVVQDKWCSDLPQPWFQYHDQSTSKL